MELTGSDGAQILWLIGTQIAVSLPLILIFLVSIVLAVANWRKHAKISALVFIASLLFLVEIVAGILLSILPVTRQLRPEQIGYIFYVAGFVRGIVSAVGFALLLWAVWSGRAVMHKPPQL